MSPRLQNSGLMRKKLCSMMPPGHQNQVLQGCFLCGLHGTTVMAEACLPSAWSAAVACCGSRVWFDVVERTEITTGLWLHGFRRQASFLYTVFVLQFCANQTAKHSPVLPFERCFLVVGLVARSDICPESLCQTTVALNCRDCQLKGSVILVVISFSP